MTHIVFFLEERSAQEMLKGLLPRLLPRGAFSFRCIPFEGKRSLQKQLPIKLRGWRAPNTLFVVLQDQDNADCHELKHLLAGLCDKAGKPETLIRIVCRELESWYLADLKAVEKGLEMANLFRHQNTPRYRDPDKKPYPAKMLQNLTGGAYQKMAGSRAIGPHLDLDNTRSASFRNFITGVRRIAGLAP